MLPALGEARAKGGDGAYGGCCRVVAGGTMITQFDSSVIGTKAFTSDGNGSAAGQGRIIPVGAIARRPHVHLGVNAALTVKVEGQVKQFTKGTDTPGKNNFIIAEAGDINVLAVGAQQGDAGAKQVDGVAALGAGGEGQGAPAVGLVVVTG